MFRTRTTTVLSLLLICSSFVGSVFGQAERPPAKAPPNHLLLSNTLSGWYFVPKEFKEQYDRTVSQLEALQDNIERGRVKVTDAQTDLAALKQRLEALRKEMDSKRVLVKGATVNEQTETTQIELGPERRLAITANHVHVIGWDEPRVKVELKKLVLSPDDKPVDDILRSMKIVHKRGRAEFTGQTRAEWDAHNKEWLAKYGEKLTEAQRSERQAQFEKTHAVHRDYVDKEIDQLTVEGLDYGSNKVIMASVMSEGGDGQYGSMRQRYGELTVYVPKCASVCIRGARRGLLVEKLQAALTILDEDSTDSDARGQFAVRGLTGNLLSLNFPLQSVADVTGHVTVTATQEFGFERGGTSHADNIRQITTAKPIAVQIHNVTDGLDAQFGRVQLDLADIQGTVNVSNDFGDTRLVASKPFSAVAHRLVTQSGRIEVELSPAAWKSLPVLAITNHGGLRTNLSREEFDDFRLEGTDEHDGTRRTWPGLRTVVKDEDRFAVFAVLGRMRQVIENTERSAGLDLFSRSGSVEVLRK